jgi:serine protease Do
VTTQLIDTGEVRRGFLGVMFGPVSAALSEAFDVPRGAAQIESVTEGSAAARAGLQAGDVIVAIDEMKLKDYNELRTIIANKLPGETVQLAIVRDGKERSVSVTLGTRDDDAIARSEPTDETGSGDAMEVLGFGLTDATPDILGRLGFTDENTKGVVITEIDRSSDAYGEADLREGDLITEIDRKPISNRREFKRALDSIAAGDMFLVRVMRPAGQTTRSFITALSKPAD